MYNEEFEFDTSGTRPGTAGGPMSILMPPGRYSVRLTSGGVSLTQPLTVVLDPRVSIAPAALAQVNALSLEMYRGARAANTAYTEARALAVALDQATGGDLGGLKAVVDSIAPAPRPAQGFGGFGGGAPAGPPTLNGTSTAMLAAAMAMQRAETAPTARDLAAVDRARAQWAAIAARWVAARRELAATNLRRKAAGLAEIRFE
jgi:hypothetical protein